MEDEMLLENILKTKSVSVWGLGYLGYTTMLKLQNSGFNVLAYDLNSEQLRLFATGKYPDSEQKAVWSRTGYLPSLNYDKIKIISDIKGMFRNSYLHIITIPESYKNMTKDNINSELAEIFSRNLINNDIRPLIIFESAFIPGHIEKYFVEKLKKDKIIVSKDYYLGALFRTDWSIEAFMSKRDKMPIAACCLKSLEAIQELSQCLEIPTVRLNSIKEAEIYVNSINVIQAMVDDFVRQLAFGYPFVNMKRLAGALFKNITFDDCVLNIGTGGTKMTFAIDYLIEGSDNPKKLTLLKEFQDINISSVLSYAEYIIRNAYKSVAILGITYKGNQKDLTLSPSVTLADYLIKNSVKVLLNDPLCPSKEIHKFVKGAEVIEFPEKAFLADVLVLASDHNRYKYLTQSKLDSLQKNVKLIIDNYGAWLHLSFGNKIKYHLVGDGTLNLSK